MGRRRGLGSTKTRLVLLGMDVCTPSCCPSEAYSAGNYSILPNQRIEHEETDYALRTAYMPGKSAILYPVELSSIAVKFIDLVWSAGKNSTITASTAPAVMRIRKSWAGAAHNEPKYHACGHSKERIIVQNGHLHVWIRPPTRSREDHAP